MTKGDRLNRLREAQNYLCAGCGKPVGRRKGMPRRHPDAPSFDHVVPRSSGGTRSILNGLVKHIRCHNERGDRPASGCDIIWHFAVLGRLGFLEQSRSPVIAAHPHDPSAFQYFTIRPYKPSPNASPA